LDERRRMNPRTALSRRSAAQIAFPFAIEITATVTLDWIDQADQTVYESPTDSH